MHAIGLDEMVNASSGVAMIALAGVVLLVRPRRPANVAFGAFAVAYGAAFVVGNFSRGGDDYLPAGWTMTGVLFAAAGLALPFVLRGAAATTPWKPALRQRWLALGVGASYACASVAYVFLFHDTPYPSIAFAGNIVEALRLGPAELPWLALQQVGLAVLQGALWGGLVLLALQYRAAAAAGLRDRASAIALLSAALAAYPCFVLGVDIRTAAEAQAALYPLMVPALLLISSAFLALFAGLWLANAHAGGGRPAAVLAWLGLAAALLGASSAAGFAGYGLTRLFGVAMLAYAIVRHQLLGLDLKVKWTIKQSTVAAAFIGVFFVASESATTFFATSGLGPYLGIAAAGMLVFAMTPLQRAAERVASAAVPAPGAAAGAGGISDAEVYALAARRFLADGPLSRHEERALARLADRLGIGAEAALEVRERVAAPGRRHVEREVR